MWGCGAATKGGTATTVEAAEKAVEPGCFLFWPPLNLLAPSWFCGKGSSEDSVMTGAYVVAVRKSDGGW